MEKSQSQKNSANRLTDTLRFAGWRCKKIYWNRNFYKPWMLYIRWSIGQAEVRNENNIREALPKNYEALHTLIDSHTDKTMFCSDDKHPNDLVVGHIKSDLCVQVDKGYDVMKVLQCACVNPVKHYNLRGFIAKGLCRFCSRKI